MLGRVRSLWHFFQYIYYQRFALLLWLALPALAFFDRPRNPSALIHAIFTPEYPGQFLACFFFATSCSMNALLLARIVCINGSERFPSPGAAVPHLLTSWLGYGDPNPAVPGGYFYSDRRALIVMLAAQVPNVYLFYRLFENSYLGDVRFSTQLPWLVVGSIVGFTLALFFWWLVSILYYWSYPYSTFKRPARTLLFPRWCFGLPPNNLASDTIERCGRLGGFLGRFLNLVFSLLPRLSPSGYSDADPSPAGALAFTVARHNWLRLQLWEGHRLATIGLFGSIAIYIFLFPMTAPLPQPWGIRVALILAIGLFGLLYQAFVSIHISPASPKSLRWRSFLIQFSILAILILCVWFAASWVTHSHPRWIELWFRPPLQFFPVMGSVAVLLTFICFTLAALAFFLDRFSFPVLTSVILVVAFLHYLFPKGEDHYYAARLQNQSVPLLTPKQIVHQRCPDPSKDCSLIVLTASGGGMHAAVWASSVFIELEKEFNNLGSRRPDVLGFHQNLVFASTVSGGSIGFAPVLREYLAQGSAGPFDITTPKRDDNHLDVSTEPLFAQRIERAAGCSSLEAVAWGLTYSDFLHLIFPFIPPTHEYDRSVSLEVASERNYVEPKCGPALPKPADGHDATLFDPSDLDHMSIGAADLRPSATIPAFTFNTTEVETGGRFLLANYANPSFPVGGLPPSESFLQVYPHANIGLVTAARLSATYPYVSSAARIDPEIDQCLAAHFVDGGYYDNDGVASLIEFLAAAFQDDPPRPKPIRILLVEIRDSWDLDSRTSPEAECTKEVGCKPWGTAQQIAAPLDTFWRTGHVSISRRDRRELMILKEALKPEIEFTEAPFPFEGNPPLSWHLSSREIKTIRNSIADSQFHQKYIMPVLDWATTPGLMGP